VFIATYPEIREVDTDCENNTASNDNEPVLSSPLDVERLF